jgi:hypothetical protein
MKVPKMMPMHSIRSKNGERRERIAGLGNFNSVRWAAGAKAEAIMTTRLFGLKFGSFMAIITLEHMKIHPLSARLIAIAVFCLSFASGYAQDTLPFPSEEGKGKKVSGGYGYASGGIGMKDVDALNSFVGNGVDFQGNGVTIGGGGMVMIRSIVIGGEGASYLKQKASFTSNSAGYDLEFDAGWGQFYAGYVVLGKRGFLLYPKVGIGGYKQSLTLTDANPVANMDTVFTGAYTGTNLVKRGMLMSFGLGFEWMPGFDETAGSGIVFGLDLGYHLGVTEKNWEAYGQDLGPAPGLSPSGMFARLHIGFGGWNRQ